MSEAHELDTTRVENEERSSTRPLSGAVDEEAPRNPSSLEAPDSPKTARTTTTTTTTPTTTTEEEVDSLAEPNNTTHAEKKEIQEIVAAPQSPTAKTLDRSKPGECNLLPVLVERLRSALEQSCSSQSSEEPSLPPEDSGVDSEEDLRNWASGLCSSMDQQRRDEAQSPRGLKLDLKFLEDLLLSDIQTALSRLQDTLKRVDVGTLTRYSSTLDPTNKLNLLKLISSLLANLKIPEEAGKPEKPAKSQSSVARRRRADRHTIGVSSEELARARKWLEEKSLSPGVVEAAPEAPLHPQVESEVLSPRTQDLTAQQEQSSVRDPGMERLEGDKHFDKVREKHMKDAINQQQSLQSRSKDCQRDVGGAFYDPPASRLLDTSYKDDSAIINEEYGITASALYHQSNAQAKCNKFLAKKSKIKRANTIDIPNYLKLQAESLANSQGGCVSLRRPINIGDRFGCASGASVIPSFEPKTENDRKFLALISKNNEAAASAPGASLPFRSFNYRQAVTDKNWNSRFSNIKTTFDRPQDEGPATRSPGEARVKPQAGEQGLVVGSLRIPYGGTRPRPGFSHAPTSPFQKIERPLPGHRDENSPGFLKSGYTPKAGSLLQAKVRMFDQETTAGPGVQSAPTMRSKPRALEPRRASSIFAAVDEQSDVSAAVDARVTENGHLNYHSFCKQFAPFASKNPADHRTNPWTNGNVLSDGASAKTNAREKFQDLARAAPEFGDDNRSAPKVPVTYQAGVGRREKTDSRERKEKPRHRKLYDTYEGPNGVAGVPDVVAYPLEVNYQKRANFGKQYRDNAAEKGDYEDPEVVRQPRSPPAGLSSLQYLKSVLPSARNPSPPPRGVFSVQSVAVQTSQTEPPRSVGSTENPGFGPRDENPRRSAAPSAPQEPSLQARHPPDQPGRSARQFADNPAAGHHQSQPPQLHQQREDPRVTGKETSLQGRLLPVQPRRSSRQFAENPAADLYQPPAPPLPSQRDDARAMAREPPHQGRLLPEQPRRSSRQFADNPPVGHYQSPSSPPPPPPPPLHPQRDDPLPPTKEPSLQGRLLSEQPRRGSRQFADNPLDHYEPSPLPLHNSQREDAPQLILQGRHPPEQPRRSSKQFVDNLVDSSYQNPPPPPPQSNDVPAFASPTQTAGYPTQGRAQLPQSVGQESHYPPSADYRTQYYAAAEAKQPCTNSFGQTAPEVPVRSNVPHKVSQQMPKKPQETAESHERHKRSYDDYGSSGRTRDYHDYPANFYHDSVSQNPIYVPPKSHDRDVCQDNHNSLSTIVSQPASCGSDVYNPDDQRSLDDLESGDISEDHSFADDENIQNQDISSEGVVTRYACAIATVSSGSASPAVSPLPLPTKDPRDERPPRIFEATTADQRDVPCRADRQSEDLSMEEIRRHNLLQQNLIRQLQGDQSVVAKTARRLSQEAVHRDEKTSHQAQPNYPPKLPEDPADEAVIESNNTQDKINIFEGRNNSLRKQQLQQQHFKPLSIPRADREPFVPPKINVVSPSKVFKPNFNADPRGGKATSMKSSPMKNAQRSGNVDSSDEYLMFCANKPSRSIVLSKSESWHQLAMSKSTLQVPQAKPSSLLKPPKPKSPSSLRLSKQYEASSSSDAIRKMEEKIQRYFQGPAPSGSPDSPVAQRRDPRTKRHFAQRKNQGSLVRSHTMPHIYDETTDVEKAFDSLFKEATRADNRY